MRVKLAAIVTLTAISVSAQVGSLQNGRYHHTATGVEFSVPTGWFIVKSGPSTGNGDTITLLDSVSKREAAVWIRLEAHPSAQIQKLLIAALDKKAASRTDLSGYHVRPDSIQPRVIGGQQALSAVADYTKNGRPAVEYLTWIFSAKIHVLIFGRAPAGELDAFRSRLDAIVNSAVVP